MILFSHEKEGNSAIYYTMDGLRKRKTNTASWYHLYVESLKKEKFKLRNGE